MFGRNKEILYLIDEMNLRLSVIQSEQKRLNDLIEINKQDIPKPDTTDKYADYRTPDGLLRKRKIKED